MSKTITAFILFGIGILGLLFSLGRTYYLVWKMKKEREAKPEKRAKTNHEIL
jgi:hypothetical protein